MVHCRFMMMRLPLFGYSLLLAARCFAATDVRVDFTLNTTDPYGKPIQESRYYYVYRPDGLSRTKVAPMVLVLEASPNGGPATFFRDIAAKSGVAGEGAGDDDKSRLGGDVSKERRRSAVGAGFQHQHHGRHLGSR